MLRLGYRIGGVRSGIVEGDLSVLVPGGSPLLVVMVVVVVCILEG